MKEQINSIPREQILTALSIKYSKRWNTLFLYEWNKLTAGWRASDIKWKVTDFSWKGRASWDRISFVQTYLWIDFKQALEWFASTFNIKNEGHMPEKKEANNYSQIKEKWERLGSLSAEQIIYLNKREIYNVANIVKNYNWNICLPIRTWWWIITSLQSRTIQDDAKSRYYVEANSESDWVFMEGLDPTKKAIIVVEWFTDFLSLRQYTTNVVGLVNAKNEWQLRTIKELSAKYDIYFVPDADEAGKICLEKMKALWIKNLHTLDLNIYWVKDVNEFLTTFKLWKEVLTTIFAEAEKPESNLKRAIQKAKEYKKMYEENWGKLGFSSGYPLIDQYTGWLIKGKTYLVMAFSNVGKTRFAYSLCREMIKQKKKIHFYSLEIDTWMLIIELLSAVILKPREWILDNIETINIEDVEKYVEVYDDVRSLDAIEAKIKEEKPDVAIIDFLQIVEHKWMEYEKLTDIALKLQKLAILSWTTLINLSQVGNESRFNWWNAMMPKWSWALFASSDVILSLWAKEKERYITIAKNKFWKAWSTFIMNVNYAISEFNIAEEFEWTVVEKPTFKKI